MNIIKYMDESFPKLKIKSRDIKKEELSQQFIDDMFDTLSNGGGIGLAAPQVGENINIFIIKLPDFEEVYINPKVELKGLDVQTNEGCLSFPGIESIMKRKQRVKIEYRDRNWKKKKTDYSDIKAIIVQHEYDHLIGKLIA